jgi:hypothetical protein
MPLKGILGPIAKTITRPNATTYQKILSTLPNRPAMRQKDNSPGILHDTARGVRHGKGIDPDTGHGVDKRKHRCNETWGMFFILTCADVYDDEKK